MHPILEGYLIGPPTIVGTPPQQELELPTVGNIAEQAITEHIESDCVT